MVVPPPLGALGDSARAALLAALLAVVVGVLIAWAVSSAGRRRRAPPPQQPPVWPPPAPADQAPPKQPQPSSVFGPYLGSVAAEKSVDPDAIHLNSASYEELRQVDGIGPVEAARILAHRRANGAFATLDELFELTGLAPEQLEAGDGRRVVL